MSLAIESFVENARTYCEWVEADNHDLLTVRQLILSLMSSIPSLIVADKSVQSEDEYGYDTVIWGRIHKHLANLPFQYYQITTAPLNVDDTQSSCGDLCDDLTDIYAELKHGLSALDAGDGIYALQHWRDSYHQHWGAHASAALYAIDYYYRSIC
ncbi:hypothetical protein Rhal01_02667 [Rubritalea halochordaticola]|uniref:DUF5063 domain-containing protein n=1 Tax=Rubritalea halochordaticola TaxID=714537 RepID=A0ABP9V1T9_9BACT